MTSEVFTSDTLEHRCVHGHRWREHTDGQVTPSWGFGGTFIDVEDPSRCPEPATDENGLYACGSCGQRHRPGDGLRGIICTPWEYGEEDGKRRECEIPPPGCLAPAEWTRRWGDRNLPWPDEGAGAMYSIWRLEQRGCGERLVCYLAGGVQSGHEVLDVHTGEVLRIPLGDPGWNPAGSRKRTLRDLPDALRHAWPRPTSTSETGVDIVWLLAYTNPDYQALIDLCDEGLLQVDDHQREFVRAVTAARGPDGVAAEIRRGASERSWYVPDLDRLLAAHGSRRARFAAEQASNAPAPRPSSPSASNRPGAPKTQDNEAAMLITKVLGAPHNRACGHC